MLHVTKWEHWMAFTSTSRVLLSTHKHSIKNLLEWRRQMKSGHRSSAQDTTKCQRPSSKQEAEHIWTLSPVDGREHDAWFMVETTVNGEFAVQPSPVRVCCRLCEAWFRCQRRKSSSLYGFVWVWLLCPKGIEAVCWRCHLSGSLVSLNYSLLCSILWQKQRVLPKISGGICFHIFSYESEYIANYNGSVWESEKELHENKLCFFNRKI